MTAYDVVIAGNGILGCATALELIREDRSLDIAVVGPATRPGAASAAAGAMLGCFAEVSHRSLGSAAGREKLDLSIRALDAWPLWLDKLNSELPAGRQLAIRTGTYVILNSRGGRLDSLNFDAIRTALREHGRTFEDVGFGDVPGLNPSVDARPLAAMYLPDEGAIDARNVLNAVGAVAARNGVTFVDDVVTGWEVDGTRATCAITGTGERMHADRFLVAAGANSHRVLRGLRDEAAPMPPIMAGKGVAATCRGVVSGPELVVRTPNRAGGCGLHQVPGEDGTVYLGATNDLRPGPDDDLPSIGMAHFLLTCAMEQLNNRLFQADVVRWHVGNRPGSFDGYPLIGRAWQDNVWVLTGTYRDGFHCSPVLARHTADTILGGTGILGEHSFSPLRRPLRTMTRDEAIDEVALHMVSQFYEYSARPPTYMRVAEGLEAQVRARTRATYELVQTDIGLAPEFLELLNWGKDRDVNISRVRRYLKLMG